MSKISKLIPRPLKIILIRLLSILRKPSLNYLEFHLTDHCNLNCKGCGHFSPLSPPYYADIKQYEIDLIRLGQLFRNIRIIRLMGGEPLLHPNCTSFIALTRKVFPNSDIRIVTNGLILTKMSASFWEVCRDTKTTIDLTAYPPLKHTENLRNICDFEEVTLTVTSIDTFYAFLNLIGDSNINKSYEMCSKRFSCPILKHGKLYICGFSAYVHYFNKKFNYNIDTNEGVNIHSQNISGVSVLNQLYRPIATCRWCAYEPMPFSWSRSRQLSSDWDVQVQNEKIQ